MKHFLKSLMMSVAMIWFTAQTQAQVTYELQIDSIVAFPDTVENGTTVSFYMMISVQNTPLLYQGNIFLELEYGGNLYPVDTVESAMAFLSPNYPNAIQATHRFSTDNDLSIGDNVVVVWPRIGNGTEPLQVVINPYSTVITLIEPNGIDERQRTLDKPIFFPNPTNSFIRFIPELELESVQIFDAQGRMTIQSNSTSTLDISALPEGIYLVQLETSEGKLYSERLVISR